MKRFAMENDVISFQNQQSCYNYYLIVIVGQMTYNSPEYFVELKRHMVVVGHVMQSMMI